MNHTTARAGNRRTRCCTPPVSARTSSTRLAGMCSARTPNPMRCHTGTPTRASKRAVASSLATKLLYQRLSWSIDVLQELRCLPGPPRRDLDHQPEPSRGAGASPAATLIFLALPLAPEHRTEIDLASEVVRPRQRRTPM